MILLGGSSYGLWHSVMHLTVLLPYTLRSDDLQEFFAPIFWPFKNQVTWRLSARLLVVYELSCISNGSSVYVPKRTLLFWLFGTCICGIYQLTLKATALFCLVGFFPVVGDFVYCKLKGGWTPTGQKAEVKYISPSVQCYNNLVCLMWKPENTKTNVESFRSIFLMHLQCL